MTLSFKQKINDKPTYFIEKIWAGFPIAAWDKWPGDYRNDYFVKTGFYIDSMLPCGDIKPKIHTIREDKLGRWKKGINVHFTVNNRTRYSFQFAPQTPCTGVQDIEIYQHISPGIHGVAVTIDGRNLSSDEVDVLASNDGFDSTEEFFEFFKSGFKGRIIHWTDLKY